MSLCLIILFYLIKIKYKIVLTYKIFKSKKVGCIKEITWSFLFFIFFWVFPGGLRSNTKWSGCCPPCTKIYVNPSQVLHIRLYEISNLKNLKYYNIVSLDRQLQPLNNEGVTSSAISFGSLASSYSINLFFLLLFIFATNFTSIDFLRSINIDTLTSS